MTKEKAAKKTTKTDNVMALLRREQGASLAELMKVTGWLPHTPGAAMTGLSKKGHAIEPSTVGGVSRYLITTGT